MKVTIERIHKYDKTLSERELGRATLEYLETYIMNGKYLNEKNILEDWEDTGHGSGITNLYGPPSETQRAAWVIIESIRKGLGTYRAD